ncbi:transglycosylase [Candidatus Brocadia pituitae]|nr:GlsB/YeaQ/YmgE family stress response membrane protein [Candidatus Brocadia sp.]MDG6026211.1 GlsB/YeaQ/YmgE family stress response membrane protein [Candidatus Brocadia sp.]BBO16138.1 transglycosylase [Candidatus Brocadia pituitae]
MNFIVWIISGIIAGWITGLVVRGRGFGIKGDLIVGLLGGLVAGALLSFIGHFTFRILGNVVTAVVGGVILVSIIRFFRRK